MSSKNLNSNAFYELDYARTIKIFANFAQNYNIINHMFKTHGKAVTSIWSKKRKLPFSNKVFVYI